MVHGRRLLVFSPTDPKSARLHALTQDWGCLVTSCTSLDELRGRLEGGEYDMVLIENSRVVQRLVADGDPNGSLLETPLADIEKRHVMRVLSANRNNKTRTARVLGIDTKTLYNKLKSYENSTRMPRERTDGRSDGPGPAGHPGGNGRSRLDARPAR